MDVLYKCSFVNEKGGQHKSDGWNQFDENVDTRSSSVFAWISHSVSHHGCFVSLWTFSSRLASLDILFRIVPGSSSIIQKQSHQNSSWSALFY